MRTKVKQKGNKRWLIDEEQNKKIMRIEDNQNGFTIKSYSWSPSFPDMYYNLDYSTAADLVALLEYFDYK